MIIAKWVISILGCSFLTALAWESFKKMANIIGELQEVSKEEKAKVRNLKWKIKIFKSGYSICGVCILIILYLLFD
ncbi:MAG: hypothetical protein ACQEWV_26225 [Bacillota bacterium]